MQMTNFHFSTIQKCGANSDYRCTLALLNKPQRQSSEKHNTTPGVGQQRLKPAMAWPPRVKCRPCLRSQRCQRRLCDLVCHALAHVLVFLRETVDILASRIQ